MRILRNFVALLIAAAITAYWLWGWWTGTGLYAQLALLEVEYLGSLHEFPTIFFPPFLAAALVLGTIGDFKPRTPAEPAPPKSKRENLRRAGLIVFLLGVALLPVGAGLYYYAQGLPDGTEAPIDINVATADVETLPFGKKVQLIGDRPGNLGAIITTEGSSSTDKFYVPVIPAGVDPTRVEVAYFQLFEGQSGANPAAQVFEQAGYIRKANLELLARDVLEQQGLTVAEVTYHVTPRSRGLKGEFEIGGYGAAGFGVLLIVASFLMWLGSLGMRKEPAA